MTPLGFTPAGDPVVLDLDRLIGSHLCVAANSGGGKSGAIRKLLEITHGHVQHVILDAEDEFYTLRERFDYVIAGGEEGDTAATLANAGDLALAALNHGFSLVAQINDLGDDAAAFIAKFLDALITAPRALWRPLLVVIDEAQRFAPSGAPSEATTAIKALLQRGRKRGFTAVLASTRVSELHPGVRGLCNNWMLGLVGQALDRRTAADQLGFTPSSAEARGLQSLEHRQFWGFGPAISREPVLFRVADVETTPVKPGQAKVPTPPAPEALREILAGLASAPSPDRSEAGEIYPNQALSDEIADLQARLAQSRSEASDWRHRAILASNSVEAICLKLASIITEIEPQAKAGDEAEGQQAPDAVESVSRPARGRSRAATAERMAVTAGETAPAPLRQRSLAGGAGSPSPAALAIADLLDRLNPARLTWSQAATLTGRKASGGNFNAARKWLRESGRINEDADGTTIRSSRPDPAGLTRAEAINLWRSVLSNPAPRMIDALAKRALSRDELGAAIGAQPRGGNFNNGLAQLRRNGVAIEAAGKLRLANPLPGEADVPP